MHIVSLLWVERSAADKNRAMVSSLLSHLLVKKMQHLSGSCSAGAEIHNAKTYGCGFAWPWCWYHSRIFRCIGCCGCIKVAFRQTVVQPKLLDNKCKIANTGRKRSRRTMQPRDTKQLEVDVTDAMFSSSQQINGQQKPGTL